MDLARSMTEMSAALMPSADWDFQQTVWAKVLAI